VKRAAEVKAGEVLELRFADGAATAVATGGTTLPKPAPKPAPKPVVKVREPGSQGSLF
jgi:exodeoxyribonuclease VII large subunit